MASPYKYNSFYFLTSFINGIKVHINDSRVTKLNGVRPQSQPRDHLDKPVAFGRAHLLWGVTNGSVQGELNILAPSAPLLYGNHMAFDYFAPELAIPPRFAEIPLLPSHSQFLSLPTQ